MALHCTGVCETRSDGICEFPAHPIFTFQLLQPGSTVVPLKGRPQMVLYELNECIKEHRTN